MSCKIFVSGLINIEANLKVSSFPITPSPTEFLFNGINAKISGDGYNVSKALSTLGDEVHIHTLIGEDFYKKIILSDLQSINVGTEGVYSFLDTTPQSIIIFDEHGNQKDYCDLKNIQETSYPESFMYRTDYKVAALTNVNFSREFFDYFLDEGIPIATNCHNITEINPKYNKAFLQNSSILFMSNDGIKGNEKDFMSQLIKAYSHTIIVIGMGAEGCMLYDRDYDKTYRIPAVTVRPVVNTIGAGDALFSAFLHFYFDGDSSLEAITKATYFASYKIGANGSAEGFLTEPELLKLMKDNIK